jgi:hypothetical protein
MYLTVCVVAGATFVFCGFWIYHYVDLGFDIDDDSGDDEEFGSLGHASGSRAIPSPSEMMPQVFDFTETESRVRASVTRSN